MKTYLIFFLSSFLLADVRAQTVRSCDGMYSAKGAGRTGMLVERNGEKIGMVEIDHGIDAGVFSVDGKSLVVYGLSKKIDLRSPQAEFLSIYRLRPRLHRIMKMTYGGAIYDVAIGSDQNLVFISNRFGFDVVNIKSRETKSFDPISEPEFSRQRCKD
ncbi:hypothetical protein [Burkholderia pseudomultivorans]|uniref:hypothetical protein n=1 Tax=Burkholderia pseudomultivorans TaxID=1207504 RepID=UPI0012DAE169|nr:hypothetical protein [Burkholderia pseudomultivorans]